MAIQLSQNLRQLLLMGDLMKLKDKKIEILAVKHTITENGFTERTLTAVCPPVWAYFRHLFAKEIFAASALMAVEEVLFIVNHLAGLNTTHVIRYKGALYDISRVDNYEGYRYELKLYAKRR